MTSAILSQGYLASTLREVCGLMVRRGSQSFQEAVETFMLFARTEGRARSTLELYRYAFQSFALSLNGIDLQEIDVNILRNYISTLLDKGYAKPTINIRLKVLRAFFNFLVKEGRLIDNPMKTIRQLKVSRQYPQVLSEQELTMLLKAPDKSTWTGFRNYTMLLTFIDTMLRLKELIDLELDDVNLATRSLRIKHGKGDKERIVYMGKRLTKAMRRWLELRGYFIGEDALFVTKSGNKLDSRNVQRILERLTKRVNITAKVSPHRLRHTGATLYIRNGGDPFSLQQLLGHSDIQTTMIYVHMAGSALREAHAKASPVDRLLGN